MPQEGILAKTILVEQHLCKLDDRIRLKCMFCIEQVSSALLSDLKTALKDLCCELQEEYRAGQHIAQQFAEAKAAWTVERTELRSLVCRVKNIRTSKLSISLLNRFYITKFFNFASVGLTLLCFIMHLAGGYIWSKGFSRPEDVITEGLF